MFGVEEPITDKLIFLLEMIYPISVMAMEHLHHLRYNYSAMAYAVPL